MIDLTSSSRPARQTFLVFGATGRTGQHFVRHVLGEGHRVRALVRDPAKLRVADPQPDLEVVRGSITDIAGLDLDGLVAGADRVVSLLGDVELQRHHQVNAEFVAHLVPAMRRHGVTRLLYQAGGLSRPPGGQLPLALRAIRSTIARGYDGQHRDNEAVMRYLTDEASDLEWMVHRAGIGSDGPSKGVLHRSASAFSIGTFHDCAVYDYRLLDDAGAIHTCDFSTYRGRP